jgi:hypothetical protein
MQPSSKPTWNGMVTTPTSNPNILKLKVVDNLQMLWMGIVCIWIPHHAITTTLVSLAESVDNMMGTCLGHVAMAPISYQFSIDKPLVDNTTHAPDTKVYHHHGEKLPQPQRRWK